MAQKIYIFKSLIKNAENLAFFRKRKNEKTILLKKTIYSLKDKSYKHFFNTKKKLL